VTSTIAGRHDRELRPTPTQPPPCIARKKYAMYGSMQLRLCIHYISATWALACSYDQQSFIPLGRVAAPVPEDDPVEPVVLDALPFVAVAPEPVAALGLMPLERSVVLDVFAAGDGFDGELRTWLVAESQHCVGLSRTWADAGPKGGARIARAESVVSVESFIGPSCVKVGLIADERPTPRSE
jgi:hypothetical protein